MRNSVVNIYIKLGFLALCIGAYVDLSRPYLIVCAFSIACTSFHKVYKTDDNCIAVAIVGFILMLILILEKVIPLFA